MRTVLTLLAIFTVVQFAHTFDVRSSAGDTLLNDPDPKPATYNFEMGFFLDPLKVLKSSDPWKLKDSVADALNVAGSIKFEIIYLDSPDLQIDANTWDVRLRASTDVKGYEITYKKRFPIGVSIGTPPANIPQVVYEAQQAGLGGSATNYAAQIDVLWSKWTLSFSNSKFGVEKDEKLGELPPFDDCKQAAIEMLPGKLEDAIPTIVNILQNAHVYGPVHGVRYFGVFMELKLEIEVWQIHNEARTGFDYVVDLSFKDGDMDISNAKHEALRSYLETLGWIVPADILKTQLILHRY